MLAMNRAILIPCTLVCLATAASAQQDLDGYRLNRNALRYEYLTIIMPRGSLIVQAARTDFVGFQAAGRPAVPAAGSTGGTAPTSPLRLTFEGSSTSMIVISPNYPDNAHILPVVTVTVPFDLKLLTIKMIGAGDVQVRSFRGELSVAADSGDVDIQRNSGPLLVNAGGRIGVELEAVDPLAPISILGRSGQATLSVPWSGVKYDVASNCGTIHFDTAVAGAANVVRSRNAFLDDISPADVGTGSRPAASGPPGPDPRPGASRQCRGGNLASPAGSPGAPIKVMTLTGDITIKRRINP